MNRLVVMIIAAAALWGLLPYPANAGGIAPANIPMWERAGAFDEDGDGVIDFVIDIIPGSLDVEDAMTIDALRYATRGGNYLVVTTLSISYNSAEQYSFPRGTRTLVLDVRPGSFVLTPYSADGEPIGSTIIVVGNHHDGFTHTVVK